MLFELWQKLSPLPFGKKIFSFLLSRKVPYTGTICPQVILMERGKVHVQMKDRRRVRNHLNSVHAIALMNLGEVSTGLAVLSTLPKTARSIITHLEIDFLKKARGTLTAKADFALTDPNLAQNKNYEVEASIYNEQSEVVAKIKAHWLIGPSQK